MLKAQMRNKSGNALLLAVGIAIGLSLGLAHGVLADKPAPGADLPWQDARMLATVLERVKHDYVNPVDDHQLLQAAIRIR
jgi:carboxyl-terminal processing protease